MEPSRRGFVRVETSKPFEVLVGPPIASSNQPLVCQGADLSVDGLSFILVDPTRHRPFSTGTVLERLSFELDGRRISVDAKVQHQAPEGNQQRVGVEFVNISPDDVWFLSAYIVKTANLKSPPVAKRTSKKKAAKKKATAKKPAKKKAVARKPVKKKPAKKKTAKKKTAKKKSRRR